MLHPQSGSQAAGHRSNLQIGRNHDGRHQHQGSGQGEVWASRTSREQRRQQLLRRCGPHWDAAIRTALTQLNPGEVVLDLDSGGGIDVLLSARRVGPTGKAYGLDMTGEMLALANENKRRAGVENVEFLKGEIEHIPLPDASVDVIISNCVINLSGDKRAVLAEAFRVLKPGGRFAVSDVVVRGSPPESVRKSMELWIGCVAGALEESQFLALLTDVGFTNPTIEPTRTYRAEDAAAFLTGTGLDVESLSREIDRQVMSAFVRVDKPGDTKCCGPDCCS